MPVNTEAMKAQCTASASSTEQAVPRHALRSDGVFEALSSASGGLSGAEASRLAEGGPQLRAAVGSMVPIAAEAETETESETDKTVRPWSQRCQAHLA